MASTDRDQLNDDKPPQPMHAGLDAPQFRLSTLMLLVTAICVLMAASLILHPLVTFALILFSLAVLAHVAGNFYGTKLRDGATEIIRRGGSQPRADVEANRKLASDSAAPQSRLTDKEPLGIAFGLSIAAGVAAGIAIGCNWLGSAAGASLSVGDYVVTAVAFGVLGGLFGFLSGAFVSIGLRAMRQAHQESDK